MNAWTELTHTAMEPWFLRALLASVAVAVPASLLGVVLYFRRMSMLPDALAHASLPGVAAGYLAAGGPGPLAVVGGALASGVAAMGLTDVLAMRAGIRPDVAIGVTYSVFFALGVVLVSTAGRGAHIDLDCVLFGNLLGVSDAGLVMVCVLAVLVGGVVFAARRALAFAAFDPTVAASMGLNVAGIDRAVGLAAAAVCAAAFEATGSVLVLAMFVLPAATAHKVSHHFDAALFVSVATGVGMSFTGLALATVMDVSPVGAIACAGAVFYAGIPLVFRRGRRLREGPTDANFVAPSSTGRVLC